MIPFVDLQFIHKPLQSQFQQAFDNNFSQSDFVIGKTVKKFEEEFAQYCDTDYCLGVSSGTAALFLTLKAMGIQNGDEVIVPSHTFIATAMAVSHCGAQPIFVDVDADSWNITWEQIAPRINEKTKAIIAVHIYGNPAEIETIVKNAHEKSILVIEDAAQAHGALHHGKKVGSIADAGCFSFYPSKNLGALGEGGAVVTNNENLAQKISKLRDYGRSDKYKHDFVGYNLRLQGLQAGFLSVKLPHLDAWNAERRRLMEIYKTELNGYPIRFQSISDKDTPVYHLGVIQSDFKEKLIHQFTEKNIGFGVHYPIACHQQEAYSESNSLQLRVSEQLATSVISLPLFVGLKDEQVKTVCENIKRMLSIGV